MFPKYIIVPILLKDNYKNPLIYWIDFNNSK